MTQPTCKTCRWFTEEILDTDNDIGECCRYPPLARSNNRRSLFPIVFDDSTCGEHKPKDDA